jgi:hypothetical protein
MKKIVIVILSRKDYIYSLKKILNKNFSDYDECHIWLNTNKDHEFYYETLKSNNKIKFVVPRESNPDAIDPFVNLKFFYKQYAVDKNSVYIKIDDDMVWFEPGFFNFMFNTRLDPNNKKYFLILPNIINNAVISNILMRFGKLEWNTRCWYNPQDPVGWGSGHFAEDLHLKFLESISNNTYHNFKFDKWILDTKELISINVISFFGEDMEAVVSTMNTHSDEFYLTNYGPSILNKQNIILGNLLCSHYSFMPQKIHLDKTNILNLYEKMYD